MEHVRLYGEKDEEARWAEWFLVHALCEAKEKWGTEVPSIPEGGLMVALTINGVQCPVIETLRCLAKQHDDLIRRYAMKYLQEQIDLQMGDIWELFKAFKDGIKEKFVAAGIKIPDED